MYDKQRAKGAPVSTEVEFRAYHLLTLIGTHGRYGYNAAEYQNALSVLPCALDVEANMPSTWSVAQTNISNIGHDLHRRSISGESNKG